MIKLVAKYTTKRRAFRVSPDARFISVYIDGRLNGFIWNTPTVIRVDGDLIVSSEFFKGGR